MTVYIPELQSALSRAVQRNAARSGRPAIRRHSRRGVVLGLCLAGIGGGAAVATNSLLLSDPGTTPLGPYTLELTAGRIAPDGRQALCLTATIPNVSVEKGCELPPQGAQASARLAPRAGGWFAYGLIKASSEIISVSMDGAPERRIHRPEASDYAGWALFATSSCQPSVAFHNADGDVVERLTPQPILAPDEQPARACGDSGTG